MVEEGKELARALREARAAQAPGGYGAALMARVATYYMRRWREGVPTSQVAKELGLSSSQLSAWSRPLRESGFSQVEVVADRGQVEAAAIPGSEAPWGRRGRRWSITERPCPSYARWGTPMDS